METSTESLNPAACCGVLESVTAVPNILSGVQTKPYLKILYLYIVMKKYSKTIYRAGKRKVKIIQKN